MRKSPGLAKQPRAIGTATDRELRRRARLPDNRMARGQKPLVSPDPMIAGSKAVARAADARAADVARVIAELKASGKSSFTW